jgi:proteasome alpha subunit
MSFPYFISPEQAMRERSEIARKGIARGRSVVVMAYAGGVLFVAENPSRSLQKVSEIYDRVGFAAVGRFNEFDSLRRGGIPRRPHHKGAAAFTHVAIGRG